MVGLTTTSSSACYPSAQSKLRLNQSKTLSTSEGAAVATDATRWPLKRLPPCLFPLFLSVDTAWWWRGREATGHTSTAWNNCSRKLWVNSRLPLLHSGFKRDLRAAMAIGKWWTNAKNATRVKRCVFTDNRCKASIRALSPRGHPDRCLLESAVPLPLPGNCCQRCDTDSLNSHVFYYMTYNPAGRSRKHKLLLLYWIWQQWLLCLRFRKMLKQCCLFEFLPNRKLGYWWERRSYHGGVWRRRHRTHPAVPHPAAAAGL